MKRAVVAMLAAAPLAASEANPLGKVVQLMDDLAAKITKEGEVEAKSFTEYMAWCDDAATNAKFSIEDATKQKGELEARITGFSSDIEVAGSKIEQLAGAIATSESDVKDATLVRDKEAADFAASEKELMETIDALGRAVGILEKEMSKNPAAFAQMDTSGAAGAVQALSTILDAASLPASDRKTLQALLQQQGSADDEDGPGAPAAATYKSHSNGIFEVLEDLKEKAEGQLMELRKGETNSKHNFEMLRQSLEDQKGQDAKDLEEEKSAKAAAEEGKATAEGDLQMATKTLETSTAELASTQGACMTTAADHEATVAGRTEELKVIAEAKQILVETSSGAVSQTYSFAQLASLSNRADLARTEVVVLLRKLAKKHHSAALSQLASRVAAVQRYGAANGEDPFAKVKGLIQDMIEKLEREHEAEATEKAYCDEQMAKTEAKKGELEDDIAKMTAKIDSAASRSAQLKEEVKVLQEELANLSREQAEMDKIRIETHEDYTVAKADLELGLTGVRKALTVLREYYGGAAALVQQPAPPVKHGKAGGAGAGIIGILEVVESDFAKNLAKEEAEEADAESQYQKVTQENKITKATKEQDEKYKTQEFKSLDKTVAEYSSDREAANSELSAVLEYYAKIKERCIAKPETYEQRKERREAEIEGLKQALKILSEETALMQRGRRGGRRHAFLAAQ